MVEAIEFACQADGRGEKGEKVWDCNGNTTNTSAEG